MKPIRNILAVVDPTTDIHPAAEKACRLGAAIGASVELFSCDYDQYLSGERFFDSKALARARNHLVETNKKKLKKLANTLSIHGVDIKTDARWGTPLDESILTKIEDSNADLIVKDTHYHNVLKRSVFSNTDWSLIRACSKPLMLVKPSQPAKSPNIIAAVDPVHENDKPAALDVEILSYADELTSTLKGNLHVFHAYDPAPAFAVSADSIAFPISVPVLEISEGLRLQHQDAMQDMFKTWHESNSYDTHIIEGETKESLLGLIDSLDADLVVMGAISRNRLKRIFLGSTAEQVLDKLPCDLLIVKYNDGSG